MINDPGTSEAKCVHALHTLGAIVRAMVRRPSPDALLCGTQSPEVVMAALLTTLTSVLTGMRTPGAKAAAVAVLLLLTLAVPNLHENVLLDYFFANEGMVVTAVSECLREPALHRSVAADCVALLVLLCNVQRCVDHGCGEGMHGRSVCSQARPCVTAGSR